MIKRYLLILFICFMAFFTGCATTNTPGPRNGIALTEGLVYGENYAFWVSAPPGWILDNEGGAKQGLHAVFYPAGSNWKDSNAVMYVSTSARKETDTLEEYMKNDVSHFMESGSRNVRISSSEPIKTRDNKTARVSLFTGDQWKNREAVAYIRENRIFVMIVLTSRTDADFRKSWDAYRALVGSYQFWTEDIHLDK